MKNTVQETLEASQKAARDDIMTACRTPSSSTVSQRALINERPSLMLAPRKNRALAGIRGYMRSPRSPACAEGHHLAKEVANYKLHNSYSFFGSLHTKTSAVMLTMFYMLGLAIFDFVADALMPDSSVYNCTCFVSTVIMVIVLLAQYGMRKEAAFCLVPLIVVQVLWGVAMVVVLGYAVVLELYCFLGKICSNARLLMFVMGSLVFSGLHCYCIVIVWRCWNYFRFTKKRVELEHAWHADVTDDEVILFDKCTA